MASKAERQRQYRSRLKDKTLVELLAKDLDVPAISTEQQIKRARLFLLLWNQNHPYDVCIAKADELYPVPGVRRKPMIHGD